MRRLLITLVLTIALLCPMLLGAVPATALQRPDADIGAKAALLMEPATGLILYEKNIHQRLYPASLTKIMTTLLALELGQPDAMVTASASAVADMDPGGSTANIVEGETMSLRDLLYCVMVSSANEGCNVVAEHIAGSVEAFVALMNERAGQLGCENTNFSNTHGLHDDNHYTTAYDMSLITRAAMNLPGFMDICNTAAKSIPPTNKTPTERALHTTNFLISATRDAQYIYYPARGIKTGHTSNAGYCLISSAQDKDLSFLSVVMGAKMEEDTLRMRSFVETKLLFEWGFDHFSYQTIIRSLDQVTEVKVNMGKDTDAVPLHPETTLTALVPNDLDPASIEREIELYQEGGVNAPVTKGSVLGEIRLSYQGREFGSIPLVATYDVERNEIEQIGADIRDFVEQDWLKYTLAGIGILIVLYIAFVVVYNRRRREKRAPSPYRGKKRRKR